jgi:hypothetical protein
MLPESAEVTAALAGLEMLAGGAPAAEPKVGNLASGPFSGPK